MTEVPGVNIGIVIHFGMVVALLGLAALTQWATHYSFVRTVCWGLASTAMVFSVRQLWRNLTYDNDPQWLGVQFGVLELSVIAILAWHIRARYAWKGESA